MKSKPAELPGWRRWTLALAALCAAVIELAAAENRMLEITDMGARLEISSCDCFRFETNFTFEAWLNVSPSPGDISPRVVFSAQGTNGLTDFRVGVPIPFAAFYLPEKGSVPVFSNNHLPLFGVWFHLAATYDGRRARLYINGRENGGRGSASPLRLNASGPLIIGNEAESRYENPFGGRMDEVRVWNRVLTSNEIRLRMRFPLTGFEPGLAGYWNFDQGDGRDASVHGNHGSLKEGARTSSSTAPIAPVPKLEIGTLDPVLGFSLSFSAEPYIHYVLQASVDFEQWRPLQTFSGQSGRVRFEDSDAPALSRRAYRLEASIP